MKKHAKHKYHKKKEFRFIPTPYINSRGQIIELKHPAYIFLQKGRICVYVTITHSKKIRGLLLIKLKKNPNPQDKQEAFWVAKIKRGNIKHFGRRKNKWLIDDNDDLKIRDFFDKKR